MQKALQYFKVLSELPGEVDIFMQSKLLSDFTGIISKKYKISEDFLTDLSIELVLQKFDLKMIDSLVDLVQKETKLSSEDSVEVSIDYLGMIILPISLFLKGLDIRSRIKKLGGEPEKYNIYVHDFEDLLEDYVYEELNEVIAENEKHFDIKEEEQIMEGMFQNEFRYLFYHSDRVLNASLISLLFADANFKNVLFKHLANNQQKLFDREIIIDGKNAILSIGSLINNFISVKGGAYFNNLTLSDYITNSKYTRGLSKDEKDAVIRLLTIYRNIRFFPRTLENVSPDKWEIFPLGISEKEKVGTHQPLSAPKSPEEQEIENLEKMAAGYELGSLERRAVEEEIRKMKLSIRYQGAVRK